MGYYFGKNNMGDLASVLSGAYNVSSPTGSSPPLNAAISATTGATPVNITNVPVPPDGGDGDGRGIGKPCESGKSCAGDSDCGTGKCVGRVVDPVTRTITAGKCDCTTSGTTTECPEGKGKTYEGCACGEEYNTKTGKCPVGYVFQTKPLGGTPVEGVVGACICQKALDEWRAKQKGNLGEYAYPPEMQSLMDLLLSRGKDLLGMPTGYSQEAQDKMFGRGFENVRAGEAGTRNTMEQGLSRQGMLGTGAGQGMLNDLSWNTEGNVANLARDLFVANEEKKKQDLIDYTTAAQSMLGSGMSFQQLLEAINASRRGEGSAALQSLLAWLLSQK